LNNGTFGNWVGSVTADGEAEGAAVVEGATVFNTSIEGSLYGFANEEQPDSKHAAATVVVVIRMSFFIKGSSE
jgi:hypothetical protein